MIDTTTILDRHLEAALNHLPASVLKFKGRSIPCVWVASRVVKTDNLERAQYKGAHQVVAFRKSALSKLPTRDDIVSVDGKKWRVQEVIKSPDGGLDWRLVVTEPYQ